MCQRCSRGCKHPRWCFRGGEAIGPRFGKGSPPGTVSPVLVSVRVSVREPPGGTRAGSSRNLGLLSGAPALSLPPSIPSPHPRGPPGSLCGRTPRPAAGWAPPGGTPRSPACVPSAITTALRGHPHNLSPDPHLAQGGGSPPYPAPTPPALPHARNPLPSRSPPSPKNLLLDHSWEWAPHAASGATFPWTRAPGGGGYGRWWRCWGALPPCP